MIDLSTNGGGSTTVLEYMTAIITNKKNRTNEYRNSLIDVLTGNNFDERTQLDLNLDGVFDDRDKDVFYDFNFAVLTTKTSFSCGNLMPFMCRDNGVCLLGEQSGGGSCQVNISFSPESHLFTISGPIKSVSKSGMDIDAGAPVDYELVGIKPDGETKDYRKLYDLDLVGSLVKEYYYEGDLLLGDANLDGEVDITDAATIQRYDVKMTHLSDTALNAADVDRDGEVCILDTTWLQRYDAKMKAPEGIGKPIE